MQAFPRAGGKKCEDVHGSSEEEAGCGADPSDYLERYPRPGARAPKKIKRTPYYKRLYVAYPVTTGQGEGSLIEPADAGWRSTGPGIT